MCIVSGFSVITQLPAGFHEIIVVIFHPKMLPKQNRSITAKYCEIRIIHFSINDDLSLITERDTIFYQRIRNRSFRFRSYKNSIFCSISQTFRIIRVALIRSIHPLQGFCRVAKISIRKSLWQTCKRSRTHRLFSVFLRPVNRF